MAEDNSTLFSIKEFDKVSDLEIKKSAKKAYMKVKKEKLSLIDSIEKILKILKDSGQSNEEIELILNSFNPPSPNDETPKDESQVSSSQSTEHRSSIEISIKTILDVASKEEQLFKDVTALLLSLSSDSSNKVTTSENNSADSSSKELFSIKELDAIDDKVVRGIAKKAYMKAKREKLLSNGASDLIIKSIDEGGKLTDDIKALLEGMK